MQKRKWRSLKMPKCQHRKFKILDDNKIGFVTCYDCGMSVPITDAFNNLIRRFLDLERRMLEILDEHDPV